MKFQLWIGGRWAMARGADLVRFLSDARVTSWIATALLAMVVLLPTLSDTRPEERISADQLRSSTFSFAAQYQAYLSDVEFGGNPMIDLAPTMDGTLYGQIRVPYLRVPSKGTAPLPLFILPADTEVDPLTFKRMRVDERGGPPRWWSCDSPQGQNEVASLILGKKIWRTDLWTFKCTDDWLVIGAEPPGGLEPRDVKAERLGSYTSLDWAATLNFRVRNFGGIRRIDDDTIEYQINVDQKRAGALAVDNYSPGTGTQRPPLIGVTAWKSTYEIDSETVADGPHANYGAFGEGATFLTEVGKVDGMTVISGRVVEPRSSTWEAVLGNTGFMFVFGVIFAQFPAGLAWCLRKSSWFR